MAESDGFSTDREAYKPSVHHTMASPIPHSVNIGKPTDMSVSSRPSSVNINIHNNHNINNSNRNTSSSNSVCSRRTSYSTTSTKTSSGAGKFSKFIPGLDNVQADANADDASSLGSNMVESVAGSMAEHSTPKGGDDADWLKTVAQAEQEMIADMEQAKIHIKTKQYANDGDKKPAAKPSYDGVPPRVSGPVVRPTDETRARCFTNGYLRIQHDHGRCNGIEMISSRSLNKSSLFRYFILYVVWLD